MIMEPNDKKAEFNVIICDMHGDACVFVLHDLGLFLLSICCSARKIIMKPHLI